METNNIMLVNGSNDGLSLGFVCKICGNTESLDDSYFSQSVIFPLCSECLKELKNLIIEKRTKIVSLKTE